MVTLAAVALYGDGLVAGGDDCAIVVTLRMGWPMECDYAATALREVLAPRTYCATLDLHTL